jgi:hypothetical protein
LSTPPARRLCAVAMVPGLLVCLGDIGGAVCGDVRGDVRGGGGGVASAAVVEFPQDLAGFSAAAGTADVAVDFDDQADGTDIGGQTLGGAGGATFNALGAPLIVVDAATTASGGGSTIPAGATNKLTATSGANVLSPGGATLGVGPDATVENDDVQLVFDQPVGFVGVDHLSQRADGQGFTRVEVFGSDGGLLLDTIIPISTLPAGEDGVIPGGADFWGVVSDANDIASITFDEVDEDDTAADNNVGYDSFRFGALGDAPPPTPGVSVPLPAAMFSIPLMLGVAEIVRRRIRR